jgi:hypothetical protein
MATFVPQAIPNIKVIQIASGQSWSACLSGFPSKFLSNKSIEEGTMYTWGDMSKTITQGNFFGHGLFNTRFCATPTPVPKLPKIKHINVGWIHAGAVAGTFANGWLSTTSYRAASSFSSWKTSQLICRLNEMNRLSEPNSEHYAEEASLSST